MALVTDPFINSLFPDELNIIPSHNSTFDEWVVGNEITGNNTHFSTQWIQCSYQMSGSYGPTGRCVFYVLVIVTVVWRRTSWMAKAAMSLAMAYSALAAVHSIVLVSIRTQMVPRWLVENPQVVLVEGISVDGSVLSTYYDTSLWLPVLPMAWDSDCDGTLAIVGTAFLVLLPMTMWSKTLQETKGKLILYLWGILLFIGFICGLISEAYIWLWAFPQLRFCPPDRHDTLPLTNDGSQTVAGSWNRLDWYHWNRTVADEFIYKNSTAPLTHFCIYPCFDSSWSLRNPTDIYVVEGSYAEAFETNAAYWLLILVYIFVGSSTGSTITHLVLSSLRPLRARPETAVTGGLKQFSFKWLKEQITQRWRDQNMNRCNRIWTSCGYIYLMVIYTYATVVSPIALVLFVVYMEWVIWGSDPGGETFRHVGQWGALVAVVLGIVAALCSWLESYVRYYWRLCQASA